MGQWGGGSLSFFPCSVFFFPHPPPSSFISSLLSLFVQTKCSCPWDTSITVNVIDIVRYMNEIQKIIKKFWRSNSIWV
jgi:hypothetical protein